MFEHIDNEKFKPIDLIRLHGGSMGEVFLATVEVSGGGDGRAEWSELANAVRRSTGLKHRNFKDVPDQPAAWKIWKRKPLNFVAAVKICQKSDDPDIHAAFRDEVRKTASLIGQNKPHLVDVYACDEVSRVILEEYVNQPDGDGIKEYVQSHDENALRNIIDQLCMAMEELYTVFQYHGDIKTDNFLLDQGADGEVTVKLTDFSLADAEQVLFCTASYIPAWQIIGLQQHENIIDVVSYYKKRDLYSFYVTIFELLFGHLPFGEYDKDFPYEFLSQVQQNHIDFSIEEGSPIGRLSEPQQKAFMDLFEKFFREKAYAMAVFDENWIDLLKQKVNDCFSAQEQAKRLTA